MSFKLFNRYLSEDSEGGGAPAPSQETGSGSVPEFKSSEDAVAFFSRMSPEDRKAYREKLEGGQEEPENKEVQTDDPEAEIPFGFTKEEWAEVPQGIRDRINGIYTEKKPFLSIDPDEIKKGEEYAKDPLIQLRLDMLKRGEDYIGIDAVRNKISAENLAKELDFVGDAEASYAKLSSILDEGLSSVLRQYEVQAQAKIEQERHLEALTKELDKVTEKFGLTRQEQLDEFAKWWADDAGQFDIVKLGGVESYQMYLLKTGKAQDLVTSAMTKGRQEVLDNLKEAEQRVGGLPRSAQGGSNSDTLSGVDVNRLKNDPDYASNLMRTHRNNPETRKKLLELASSN